MRTRRSGAARRAAIPAPRGGMLLRVVAAALLALGGVATSASARETASYRTQALPAAGGHAAAARAGRPAAQRLDLRTEARFSLVGLRWRSAHAQLRGQLRAQRTDGSWTDWMGLEPQQGADGVTRGADGSEGRLGARRVAATGLRGATEPLWTGPARRLQVRLTGPRPRGLHAALVDVNGAPVRRRARAARQADAGLAGIQPRAAWDPDNSCRPRTEPAFGTVQAVVVHHTVGTNTYSQAQVPEVILAICKFHRNGNGWNDIGYNVLVDRFGGAWEGRAGGITSAVIGAQAQGFNAITSGISMLGDFQTVAPSPAQLATVARVAAWRLAVAGVPRAGTVELTSAGGSQSRFRQHAKVTLPRVIAHRDVGLTECPGNAAYGLLGQVRDQVAAADPTLPVGLPGLPSATPAPVKITISTKRSITVGSATQVRGTATQGGTPLKSATVALEVSSDDERWEAVTHTRTSRTGTYRLTHRFSRSWKLRVVRTDGDGGTSAAVAMRVVPKLALRVPKRLPIHRRTVLRGTIAPGRGDVSMTIERRTPTGKYVAGSTVPVTRKGRRLIVAITPHSSTLYRFRLRAAASDLNAAARSSFAFGRATSAGASGGTSVAR